MAARKHPEPKRDTQGRRVDGDGVLLGSGDRTADPGMQAAADVDSARGHRGVGVDPTPNDAYTVAGVLAGEPTPETDRAAAKAARDALASIADERT